MKTQNLACLRIALQIEKNRAHGRSLLKGIADYALEKPDWRLELVDPTQLTDYDYVKQFDGLIVRVMDDATAKTLLKARVPVVDTYGRMDDNPMPSIRLDDAQIAERAFQCLSEHHHYRALAYCGFPGLRFSNARRDAFLACAERSGKVVSVYNGKRKITDKFFRNETTDVPDAAALGSWLAALPKPIALFCCNDLRAVQVLNVCSERGICVPKEIAVMGADNDVLLCTFAKPSLSSVETDSVSLGRHAAEMLDRQMKSRSGRRRRSAAGNLRLWPPKRVVERMSTDAYQFETPWLEEAVRYIRRNLSNGVTAAEVVKHVGYSHPKVTKVFVAELGHTVKQEIRFQRGLLACALLKETDYTLGEIAKRCGYPSSQYFSYCFAEAFGQTPDVWRRQHAFQES